MFTQACTNVDENDSYAYEYDNNDRIYSHIDENEAGDYCDIDEVDAAVEQDEVKEQKEIKVNSSAMCLTLKKSDEKIRREIRLATSNAASEASRMTMCDQMLLKFYLKHVEENLEELRFIYEILSTELVANESKIENEQANELANKLALNGHKLLFICDTLERNISNKNLKQTLSESSVSLCESLQLYMIRIKSASLHSKADNVVRNKQRQLIKDSLVSVFNSANCFKQNILKYYFKSF